MRRGSRLIILFSIIFLCSLLFTKESLARRGRSVCGPSGCGIPNVGSCGQRGGCQPVQNGNQQQNIQNNNNNINQDNIDLGAVSRLQAIIGAGNFGNGFTGFQGNAGQGFRPNFAGVGSGVNQQSPVNFGAGSSGIVNPVVGGSQQGLGDATSGAGHNSGVIPTQPGGRLTDTALPTKFSNWKKLYEGAENNFEREQIHTQISEATIAETGEEWKMKVFPQKCANSAKPDEEKEAVLLMFSKNNESYFMIKKSVPAVVLESKSGAQARKDLFNEAVVIGKPKNPADPEAAKSLIQAFSYSGDQVQDYTEVQHRIRPILTDGKITGFTTAQLLRHKDEGKEPKDRWGTSDRDIEMYCKTVDGEASKVGDTTTPEKEDTAKKGVQPPANIADIMKTNCLSCHKPTGDNPRFFDGEGNLSELGLKSIGNLHGAIADRTMPQNETGDFKTGEADRTALLEWLATKK